MDVGEDLTMISEDSLDAQLVEPQSRDIFSSVRGADEASDGSSETSEDESMHSEACDAARPVPVGLFALKGPVPVTPLGDPHECLGQCFQCDGYRVFDTNAPLTEVLVALREPETLEAFGTKKVPLLFQGSGCFVVLLSPQSQGEKAYDLVSKDQNGGWKQSNCKLITVESKDGSSSHYLFRDYLNKNATDFGRKIVFEVEGKGETSLCGQFVLVAYHWKGDTVPHQFAISKQYQPRSIGSAIKGMLEGTHRGKVTSASTLYHEASSSCSTTDDIEANPFYKNSGGKRFVSFVRGKQTAKRCGKLDAASLGDMPNVISRQFESEGQKINYIVSSQYLLSLMAQNGHNPVQIDVTFRLSNFYVVTTTIAIDSVTNRRTGTKTFIAGPVMFTQCQTEISYDQLAAFLADELGNQGWDLQRKKFSFVTDGETAIVIAMEKNFPFTAHTFCVIHARRNVKRKLQQLVKQRTGTHALRKRILTDIFGSVQADGTLKPGLIDCRSEDEYLTVFEKLDKKWSAPEFSKWFRTYQERKFLDKLILPARSDAGLGTDLPHTNYAESLHSKFKKLFGKRNDIRIVMENVVNFHKDQKEELAAALLDHGPYQLAEFVRDELQVNPEKAHDQAYVQKQAFNFFGCAPGELSCIIQIPVTLASRKTTDDMLIPFESAGLSVSYMETWSEARSILDSDHLTTKLWMQSEPKAAYVSCIVESMDGRLFYKVTVCQTSGKPSCTCSEVCGPGTKKLCRHIVAVAAKAKLLPEVISWANFGRRASVSPDSGNKPGSHKSKYRGTGNTKRDGRTWNDESGLFPTTKRICSERSEGRSNDSAVTVEMKAAGGSGGKSLHLSSSQPAGTPVWAQEYAEEPFLITKAADSFHANVKCAGCKVLFKDSPPHMGLAVIRNERDYRMGTKTPTEKKTRHYHMQMSCIRKRHKGFNVLSGYCISYDAKWYPMAVDAEKEYADMFRKGLLF